MSGIGPQNGVPGDTTRMKRGCLTGMLILCLLATGLIYMFMQARNAWEQPAELKPYMTKEAFLPLLSDAAPTPPPTARLTADDVAFYVGAIDSIDAGWRGFSRPYDSLRAVQSEHGGTPVLFDPMELNDLGKLFFRVPLFSRRALVPYLNRHGRSWEEYRWTKRRVIAASGITRQEASDTVHAFMTRIGFDLGDERRSIAPELFDEVERVRAGGIDSAEQALVAPHRTLLLTKGIHSLTDTEEMFYGEE